MFAFLLSDPVLKVPTGLPWMMYKRGICLLLILYRRLFKPSSGHTLVHGVVSLAANGMCPHSHAPFIDISSYQKPWWWHAFFCGLHRPLHNYMCTSNQGGQGQPFAEPGEKDVEGSWISELSRLHACTYISWVVWGGAWLEKKRRVKPGIGSIASLSPHLKSCPDF